MSLVVLESTHFELTFKLVKDEEQTQTEEQSNFGHTKLNRKNGTYNGGIGP